MLGDGQQVAADFHTALTFTVGTEENDTGTSLCEADDLLGDGVQVDLFICGEGCDEGSVDAVVEGASGRGSHCDSLEKETR